MNNVTGDDDAYGPEMNAVVLGRVITPARLFAAALAAYTLWAAFFRKSSLPTLPIVGHDEKQWFAWPRTLWRAYFNYRPMYWDAYQQYLSKGQACIMPEPNDTHVVLPSSLSQWLCDQPDRVLSAAQRQNDFLQTRYTFPVPKMAEHPYHMAVIKRDLTRRLSALTGEIWDELDASFRQYWGDDAEAWREVNLMETMLRIVTRTSNRLFVGKEACSNEKYLDCCTSFAQDVPLSGIFIRMLPRFLQPVFAPIITLPNRWHTRQIRSLLRPEIERRLALHDAASSSSSSSSSSREKGGDGDDNLPNDFLQWFVSYARRNLEAEESTPKFIADRIATINFAAIHTSTFSIVNTVLDVITCGPDQGRSLLNAVGEEVTGILTRDGGAWTKTSVQRMVVTDSVLRESMRYSTFMTGGVQRCVSAREGVTTPDGLHIPYGNMVEVPAWPRHLDPQVYPSADEFVPLRFVVGGGSSSSSSSSAVDTSHEFLTFSHGRHACPGRFFAANELKLLLAHMAVNYEIEPLVVEPKAISFGSVMTPNPKVSVRIRRRATTGCSVDGGSRRVSAFM